jgi:phosphoserine/homoserine phosphotransferase
VEEFVRIVCLDLEGVLIPEMWIMIADATGIEELRVTTRDIADYDKLMEHRLAILTRENLTLSAIQEILRAVQPIPGASDFLAELRRRWQVAILSDTFVEFAAPAMECLGYPFLLCNSLVVDDRSMITGYRLRQPNGKLKAIEAFRNLNLEVLAIGDSFNDISMIRSAHGGFLFTPSTTVSDAHPDLPTYHSHTELLESLVAYRHPDFPW